MTRDAPREGKRTVCVCDLCSLARVPRGPARRRDRGCPHAGVLLLGFIAVPDPGGVGRCFPLSSNTLVLLYVYPHYDATIRGRRAACRAASRRPAAGPRATRRATAGSGRATSGAPQCNARRKLLLLTVPDYRCSLAPRTVVRRLAPAARAFF